MKKYLLPILIAGAGAVIFFTMKKKKDDTDKFEDVQDTPIQSTPRKKSLKSKVKDKLKDFDINSAVNKISNLASKGKQIIAKRKIKKKSKKAVKQNIKLPPSPLQPKAKEPVKFY
jgi:ABC-type Na+ efflux pump permease subunit